MEYSEQLNKHIKDLLVLGYIDFKADLVMCLLREIDRCHALLDAIKSQPVASKSVIRRLETQVQGEG